VPGYHVDGRADVAVYRESTAEWFIRGADARVATWPGGASTLGDVVRPF